MVQIQDAKEIVASLDQHALPEPRRLNHAHHSLPYANLFRRATVGS
jgi:hypothetical protein